MNVTKTETIVKEAAQRTLRSSKLNGSFVGRTTVDGTLVEYRAFILEDGSVNIGTIFAVK